MNQAQDCAAPRPRSGQLWIDPQGALRGIGEHLLVVLSADWDDDAHALVWQLAQFDRCANGWSGAHGRELLTEDFAALQYVGELQASTAPAAAGG